MTDPAPASSRRAIFLDVDGTYAHHGRVPEAHAEAVRAARRAGHLVLLCTGRPVSLLPEHITAAGFDGFIAGAGAYAILGDEVLLDTRFPAALAARAIEALDAHGALYFLEAPDATHARPATIEAMSAFLPRRSVHSDAEERGRRDVTSALRPSEELAGVEFGKITSVHAEVPLPEIAALVGPDVAVIPSSIPDLGPGAGEMFLADVHKAVGIAAVVERLGLERAQVVAFGDGPNDLEMLEYAGVAVAIEGSDPELLDLADHVAGPPDREGLAAAFAELGLLG
ncbi:HAD family hydrolase [Demequina sp. SYSU T00192]|uniref:HAD family hydrolase n=1 Tax=Demequina litoralis TaxID=3051660 RepID=A0ABT8GCI8_9MICO|nr:HAD family hydrolase [Demequina sp. SYSU T00192]MDN4476709.1 HAD family hydrolase [Demequina sp. SYSU T00192]